MKLLGAILIVGATILGGVQAAGAGGATDAALGLGAFAVFNQFVRGETIFQSPVQPAVPVVVQQPVVVAAPPPVVAAPPPVVYVTPPAPVVYYGTPPVVYYATPPVVYGRAPASYAPSRVPPGLYRRVPPPWRGQYRRH